MSSCLLIGAFTDEEVAVLPTNEVEKSPKEVSAVDQVD